MIGNQLIATLRGQDLSSHENGASAEETNAPASRAKDPRLVELPANKEPVLVVIQVCLMKHDSSVWTRPRPRNTTDGTYHNRHARGLQDSRQYDQKTEKPPAVLAEPLPTREYDQIGNDAHALEHDGKGHQEPDGPPHGTEVPVLAMTIFALREALAGIGEGGAALVEAVRVAVGRLEGKTKGD